MEKFFFELGSVVIIFSQFFFAFGLKIPVLFDSSNVWHRSTQYHPEQPARIDACVKKIRNVPGVVLRDVTPNPKTQPDDDIQIAPFSQAELDHAKNMLLKAHSSEFIENLERKCRESRQRRMEEGKDPLGFVGNIDADTYVTTETFDVCLRATAAWIRTVNSAMDEENDSRAAMALTRPPGHHATRESANGFCLVNFAAAAAIHAMERDSTLKVSVFDWDVHFGQGVANILGQYERARYVSIHQTPAFPYLGQRLGVSGEYNNTKTVPIIADTGWTSGYRKKFEDHVLPFIAAEDWQPDLVLICAGYDALDSDDLASVALTAMNYQEMAFLLKRHLRSSNGGKYISIAFGLEGGYQLSEMAAGGNLGDAVLATIEAMLSD